MTRKKLEFKDVKIDVKITKKDKEINEYSVIIHHNGKIKGSVAWFAKR